MDLNYLVSGIRAQQQNLRLRQAEVVTLNADYTIDVRIAGDPAVLPSVRYLSNFAPLVGYHVWVIVDKNDMLAIGHVARDEKTLAPTAYMTTTPILAPAVYNTLEFGAVRNDGWDTWNIADPTKITAPLTGYYQATAAITCEAQNNVDISVGILLNGTQAVIRQDVTTVNAVDGFHGMVTSTPFKMTKGDYLQCQVKHNHTGGLQMYLISHGFDHTGYYNCLSITYLGS